LPSRSQPLFGHNVIRHFHFPSKTYKSGFEALKDINLEIRQGEIFALLGPNGAAKPPHQHYLRHR
jgi:ABC-type Fe3+/spermidine/putrescine transport system ATPase subunit